MDVKEYSKIEKYLKGLPKGKSYEFSKKVLAELPEEEALKEAYAKHEFVTEDGLTATEDGSTILSSDDLDDEYIPLLEGNTYVYTNEKAQEIIKDKNFLNKSVYRGHVYKALLPYITKKDREAKKDIKKEDLKYKSRPILVMDDSLGANKIVQFLPIYSSITAVKEGDDKEEYRLDRIPQKRYPILDRSLGDAKSGASLDKSSCVAFPYIKDKYGVKTYPTIIKKYIFDYIGTMNENQFEEIEDAYTKVIEGNLTLLSHSEHPNVFPESDTFAYEELGFPREEWLNYRKEIERRKIEDRNNKRGGRYNPKYIFNVKRRGVDSTKWNKEDKTYYQEVDLNTFVSVYKRFPNENELSSNTTIDELNQAITKYKELNSNLDLKEFLNSKGKNTKYTNISF